MTGRLYGVGVGPGDPSLMTVRAVDLVRGADVVAYHCARHGRSHARSIVAQYLGTQIEEQLTYPVTTEQTDDYQGRLDAFYAEAAARLAAHLDAGPRRRGDRRGRPVLLRLLHAPPQAARRPLPHRGRARRDLGVRAAAAVARPPAGGARRGPHRPARHAAARRARGPPRRHRRRRGDEARPHVHRGPRGARDLRAPRRGVLRRARLHRDRAHRGPRRRRPGHGAVLLRRDRALAGARRHDPAARAETAEAIAGRTPGEVVVVGLGPGRPRPAHPRGGGRARVGRRRRRLRDLHRARPAEPPPARARLGQPRRVRTGRVRPGPGALRSPGGRRVVRRPGGVRDGVGRRRGRRRPTTPTSRSASSPACPRRRRWPPASAPRWATTTR